MNNPYEKCRLFIVWTFLSNQESEVIFQWSEHHRLSSTLRFSDGRKNILIIDQTKSTLETISGIFCDFGDPN